MSSLKWHIWPLSLLLMIVAAACTSPTPQTIEVIREVEVTRVVEAEVKTGIEAPEWFAARQATEMYVDVAAAEAAGYQPITECMADPAKGAMGIHYANLALLEDPALDVTQPEALMYQPLPDGRMELLGVEYLVPKPAWTGDEPPTLLGQTFEYVEAFDVYALHLWAWRHNPNGLYADWHPNVSCAAAEMAGD